MLVSYLTYQAVRVVLNQLRETDPPRALWFNGFSSREKLQDGEAYLTALLAERPELALRVMTVRQHLAEEVTEFLPEMVRTGIQEANMNHRRHYLEQVTHMQAADLTSDSEPSQDSESD